MWFARGADEPATSMEVRLLSDLNLTMQRRLGAVNLGPCEVLKIYL